jgi:hypothetical protein
MACVLDDDKHQATCVVSWYHVSYLYGIFGMINQPTYRKIRTSHNLIYIKQRTNAKTPPQGIQIIHPIYAPQSKSRFLTTIYP